MKKNILLFALILVYSVASAYDAKRAKFSIHVNGELNPYKIFSVFVLPNSPVNISSQSLISLQSNDLKVTSTNPYKKEWKIIAPSNPGNYLLLINDEDEEEIKLNVLVLTPLEKKNNEFLNNYRVGNYPATPLKGNPIYDKPKGLFEVTEKNKNLQLSPHFTLGQFICKQEGKFPKYLIVKERLLLKLEYLLERVNEQGFECNTFGFISGYRTPFYNKFIGNVQYSRHVFGGAADIFIDQNKDGNMDDLNKDGVTDDKDVRIFYNLVEAEFDKMGYDKFKGGLGFYKKNGHHFGFIHVDVRGWKARW